ncbi:MAG: sporulation transcription factor Spo0A, partial [Clostridiales bacterium]|nr:sporulation transcription factor Spo0A [Clostridiales bacterium]
MKHIKLLIANDSADFIRDYGRIFEQSGMEIIYTQKDGMKLLEKIESIRPDGV